MNVHDARAVLIHAGYGVRLERRYLYVFTDPPVALRISWSREVSTKMVQRLLAAKEKR